MVSRARQYLIWGGLLLMVAVLLQVAQRQRLFELAWFDAVQWFAPSTSALGLEHYRAVVQGQPIAGLPADVSALTFLKIGQI